MATLIRPAAPPQVRGAPAPLHGGPLELLRFARRNRMLTLKYGRLVLRWGSAMGAA